MAQRPDALWETTRADGTENLKSSRCFPKKPRRRRNGPSCFINLSFWFKSLKTEVMLELKISSPSSYLDLWARNPESDSCCFLSLTLYFFQVWNFLAKKKTELKLVIEGDALEATGDLLQTDQPLLSEQLHLEVEPSATFDVTIVDSCFHPSISSRGRWSDRLADECESPCFNIINQWGKKKAPFGTFVI